MDAKYIKRMLNNSDLQPLATINHWIVAILLFSFILKYILDNNFPLNGLLRHLRALKNTKEEDNFEKWINDICGLYVMDTFVEF